MVLHRSLDPDLDALVLSMLQGDPTKRATLPKIKEAAWLRNCWQNRSASTRKMLATGSKQIWSYGMLQVASDDDPRAVMLALYLTLRSMGFRWISKVDPELDCHSARSFTEEQDDMYFIEAECLFDNITVRTTIIFVEWTIANFTDRFSWTLHFTSIEMGGIA